WRLLREGAPGAFDGFFYLRHSKEAFYEGWFELSDYSRDPPGFTLILLMAETIFGFTGEPILWSIYIFPQIISSLQLLVYFILARRLTKSRINGLLTMLFTAFVGLFVYRDHNVAPDGLVIYLVPFVVFALYRYIETKDFRYMILALLLTFVITMTHHMTTFIAIALWHFVLVYELLFQRVIKKRSSKKQILIFICTLVALDIFVVIYWIFGLQSFPITFLSGSLSNAFTGASIGSTVIMIVGVLGLVGLAIWLLFYDFTKKKVNIAIVILTSVLAIVIFIIVMFFSTSSPEQTLMGAFVIGSPIIVIPPLFAIGLINIPKNTKLHSRILRGYTLCMFVLIAITAAVPIMATFAGRVALYLLAIGLVLVGYGVTKIVSKVNTKKLKTLALVSLIGSMCITITFAYPAPSDNFYMQEVFFNAEFSAVDYVIIYENLEHPTWIDGENILVDCDWRLAAIVEGYGGLESAFDRQELSWLRAFLLTNETLQDEYIVSTSPWDVSTKLDYIFITDSYFDEAYQLGWPAYGGENEFWFTQFPEIKNLMPLNPYVHRIYCNDITYILVPFYFI
ncbi:MAG: ArnT family glycosyltransferase, partial [Candidatus Heimdallarchaeota archaeon]